MYLAQKKAIIKKQETKEAKGIWIQIDHYEQAYSFEGEILDLSLCEASYTKVRGETSKLSHFCLHLHRLFELRNLLRVSTLSSNIVHIVKDGWGRNAFQTTLCNSTASKQTVH